MSPDRVIVVADPVACLSFKRSECRPRPGMDQLFLVSREERFRHGIVIADPCPAEGPPDLVLLAVGGEYRGRVLAAAVGMEYHPGRRLACRDGHVEGSGDQAGPHMRGDSPANYLA